MTNAKTLQDDIAFMRDLAEAGASTPLVIGRTSILSGAVYGTASLLQWYLMNYVQPEGWVFFAIWLAAMAIGFAGMRVLVRGLRRLPGASSSANRAAGRGWQASSAGIVAIFLSACVLSYRLNSTLPMAVLPSMIISCWGVAWMISASTSGQKWMWAPVAAAFGLALAAAWFIASPHLFLIFAAALYLLGVGGGLMMVRKEPALVV